LKCSDALISLNQSMNNNVESSSFKGPPRRAVYSDFKLRACQCV
jgi:hypothetical protein